MKVLAPFRVIPVCSMISPSEAAPLAEALISGGLPVVEVTLRAPDALEGLAALARDSGLLVGAGTVRTAEQLHRAVDAGAQFVVSPCLTDGLARAALEVGIPFLPGAATATEIQRAVDAGFDTVKFFPAEAAGGLDALLALSGPFGDVTFLPTGGISEENAWNYLQHPQVLAVGGSWMLPRELREAGEWAAVVRAVEACTRQVSS